MENGSFDAYIVFDSDLHSVSLEGILHSLSYWGQFDAMASNGLKLITKKRKTHGLHTEKKLIQYDCWAWREESWDVIPYRNTHHRVPARGSDLISVWSAFGGMCIYPRAPYETTEYSGEDCEHVKMHKAMREKGFGRIYVNPSQITLY
jgi:hypothetical protein